MGSLLLIGAMAGFSLSDALVQRAGSGLQSAHLAWLRYVLLLLSTLPLLVRNPSLARSKRPGVQVLRAAGLVGSAVLFLQGLKALPIADATALVFASPLYVTLLSALLLREPVGLWRNLPVVLGFTGVLIVAQPGGAGFQTAMLYPMLSSMAWATAVICTRLLSEADSATTTMLYSAALGVVALSPALPTADTAAVAVQWPWLLAMAVAWCLAQWMTILAYRLAPPGAIAPFSYSQMLWAAILGWLLFGQVPSARTALGMSVIALSGVMAAWMANRPTTVPAYSGRQPPPSTL